eukprot:3326031-Prymnesium_polylepis.1
MGVQGDVIARQMSRPVGEANSIAWFEWADRSTAGARAVSHGCAARMRALTSQPWSSEPLPPARRRTRPA